MYPDCTEGSAKACHGSASLSANTTSLGTSRQFAMAQIESPNHDSKDSKLYFCLRARPMSASCFKWQRKSSALSALCPNATVLILARNTSQIMTGVYGLLKGANHLPVFDSMCIVCIYICILAKRKFVNPIVKVVVVVHVEALNFVGALHEARKLSHELVRVPRLTVGKE